MKFIVLVAVFHTAAAADASGGAVAQQGEHMDVLHDTAVGAQERFALFRDLFGKTYADTQHEQHAVQNFVANDKKIVQHNAMNFSWTLGHNQFSDLSADEFRSLRRGCAAGSPPRARRFDESLDTRVLADSVDWTEQGAVTAVKDQGRCGSCWSFSTTGSVEGAYQIAGNPLTSFSEQMLVSCASSSGNQGCNGGLMDEAFKWIESNGLCTEDDYPYSSGGGTAGSCNKACVPTRNAVTGFADVPVGSESGLLAATNIGPVSVAVDAGPFQLYHSGVLDTSCGTNLDHGVLVVGYTADYIKIKNSWGASWGEQGYIRLARGKNMCGVANSASYPKTSPVPAPGPPPPSPAAADDDPSPAPAKDDDGPSPAPAKDDDGPSPAPATDDDAPGSCIADNMCSGGDMGNCCSGAHHQTLRCGVDDCDQCEQIVQKIGAAASQGCDGLLPQVVCAAVPGAFQSMCTLIVTKSCDTVLSLLAKGESPEQVCNAIGFCGQGYRCGCLKDNFCALGGASDCCSGKLHATARCAATVTGGGRCGCVPSGSCAQHSTDCCSQSFHKTIKCGAFFIGGMCS
jgi:hypothetical protein